MEGLNWLHEEILRSAMRASLVSYFDRQGLITFHPVNSKDLAWSIATQDLEHNGYLLAGQLTWEGVLAIKNFQLEQNSDLALINALAKSLKKLLLSNVEYLAGGVSVESVVQHGAFTEPQVFLGLSRLVDEEFSRFEHSRIMPIDADKLVFQKNT